MYYAPYYNQNLSQNQAEETAIKDESSKILLKNIHSKKTFSDYIHKIFEKNRKFYQNSLEFIIDISYNQSIKNKKGVTN